MQLLLWQAITDGKKSGLKEFDLGRSDVHDQGLSVFKDRLGARRQLLTYYRYTNIKKRQKVAQWDSRVLREFFCSLPDTFLSAAGGVLYKHMG